MRDARGWELHLRDPESAGNQTKYFSHGGSFCQACEAEELEIVKSTVERTQVGLAARGEYNMTPLHMAAQEGHFPVVQYLCEQGAAKEAKGTAYAMTPLRSTAFNGHLPVVQYPCEHRGEASTQPKRRKKRP